MSNPFLGGIKPFSFNFPPKGWAACNGQLLPINQNQALFSLLGTFYGGNGQTTFALPNLQGNFALCMGNGYAIGQTGGESSHTLSFPELAAHNHALLGSTATADQGSPIGNYPAVTTNNAYFSSAPDTPVSLLSGSGNAGGSQGHENRPPFLVLNFCIALQGIFPSRN